MRATASEQRLRDVLEDVHVLAVTVDARGRMTFVNRYMCQLTGWTQDELLGRDWSKTFNRESTIASQLARDAVRKHEEATIRTRTGEIREIAWSTIVTRDARGMPVSATGIGQDVTDRNQRAREEAALRRVATMVAAEAAPEEIFATVTHDVGMLFGGQTANLVRFDEDDPIRSGVVIAGWSEPGVISMPIGEDVTFDGPIAIAAVIQTKRPARMDDYSRIPGSLAERLRALGLSSSVAAPITVDGRQWGAITVSTTGTTLLPPDAELHIGQFTELVALAISNAEARDKLAASRARIVGAGDAERRRLERNLHDGAQQRLVSLSVALRMVQSALPPESEPAALLHSASRELAEALEELRELARGIHPALLTDHGLEPAIRALTARCAVPVETSIELNDRLAPSAEAAVYYVIAEALTNIVKYAHADGAHVVVWSHHLTVCVDVSDDGVGGADPSHGSGLHGLVDRVEALGGHLSIDSPPGQGTRLRADLPLATPTGATGRVDPPLSPHLQEPSR